MRLRSLPAIFLCFISSFVYAQDAEMEKLMSKRIMTYDDATYNLVLQLPRLYREKKNDTLAALINYYEKNFGTTREVVPFIILNDISKRTFNETLKYYAGYGGETHEVTDSEYYEGSILSYYMLWYKDNNYNPGNDKSPSEVRAAYDRYFSFIVSESKALLNNKTLTPVEKWLLNYFIDPSRERFDQLADSEFNGSLLQNAWYRYKEEVPEISGSGFSILTGVWSPTGKLAILGNHPYIGYTIGGKFDEHFLMDVRFDVRFIKTPQYVVIAAGKQKFGTSHFWGMNIGLDLGYEIFRHKKHELDFMCGVAWDYFETLTTDDIDANDLESDAGTFSSVNLNGGLAYRLFVSHRYSKGTERFSYIMLKASYNMLFHHNNGGSDFSGNAWTIGLSYGGFSRKTDDYNIFY